MTRRLQDLKFAGELADKLSSGTFRNSARDFAAFSTVVAMLLRK